MPEELSQEDIDALLSATGGEDSGDLSGQELDALLSSAQPMDLPDFEAKEGEAGEGGARASIEMLYDVELNVRVELGRTRLTVEDILRLREGSVVTFDKEAGAPVDILVNGRLVARGEVLVLNDLFCVRVTEVLSSKDRAVLTQNQE